MQAFHFYSRLFTLKTKLTAADEATFLLDAQAIIESNKEIDIKILVPLVRRRAREGMFSSRTRDQIFEKLGVKDTGNKCDEKWIDARATWFNLDALWLVADTAHTVWSGVSAGVNAAWDKAVSFLPW